MDQHTNTIWDVIIVGGGPAGCAAAVLLARCRRKVLVIDEGKQRNLKSHGIHNYLTRDGVLPGDFIAAAHAELARYHVTLVKARAVKANMLAQHGFNIEDNDGNKYISRRLLIATGVVDNIPDVPGMKELWGCGVYHCPYCDGWESCDKVIGLYSSKFNGYGMALALRQLTDKVILFTDKARYLRPAQRAQLAARNIQVRSAGVNGIAKDENGMINVSLQTGEIIPCECIFTNSGNKVNNDLIIQLGGQCNTIGSVLTNKLQECNIPGVYVAGDVVFDVQFVALAAAEGVKAAMAIHNSLLKADNM